MISFMPWRFVINVNPLRYKNCLAKIYQPNIGLTVVMDKKKGAAY